MKGQIELILDALNAYNHASSMVLTSLTCIDFKKLWRHDLCLDTDLLQKSAWNVL